MSLIEEDMFIEALVRTFPRSHRQLNRLQESDAELVRLDDTTILAVTTDSICEEIETGLYDDPYLIGWMTVAVNLSDLAAVGASQLGIILNQTFTRDCSRAFIDELQRGIADACVRFGTAVLGGDTNTSLQMQMGGAAFGIIRNARPLMRSGCSAGDHVYASGALGEGNAFAFSKLSTRPVPFVYLPEPRIEQGKLLLKHAACCIDTSDGLIAALDHLMRVNRLGFSIDAPVSAYLSAHAIRICGDNALPPWIMCAGPHGEFELVFAISDANVAHFLDDAHACGWEPIRLGEAVNDPAITMNIEGNKRTVDSSLIRNLFAHADRPLAAYLETLAQMDDEWRRS